MNGNLSAISIRFLIVTATSLMFLVCPPARAVTVDFGQIDWGDGTGGYQEQNSAWGQANVAFSVGDLGLLTSDGAGGYYGFLNLVTTVAGGTTSNWAVQNLAFYFDSSDIGGDLPTSVDFDLGTISGFNVGSLDYGFSITAAPLSLQPFGVMTTASVADDYEVIGLQTDPDDTGGPGGGPATNYQGAPAGSSLGQAGRITGSETNIAVVAEQLNGCAPGAAARSIAYLARNGLVTTDQTAQQMYGALTNAMKSFTGLASTNGGGTSMRSNGVFSAGNFAVGKNAFVASNGLSIAGVTFTNNLGAAISALRATNDVELWISWGYTVNAGVTNYRGGHAVFVSQIIPITNAAGQVVRYQIRYIEDPNQGGNSTSNQVRTMTINASNRVDINAPAGVQGQGVVGFMIEGASPVPEPSTLVLSALGVGVLAWLRRRRRGT